MSHQAWINDISVNERLSILEKHPRAIIHINEPTFKEIKTVIDADVDALKTHTIMCPKGQEYFIRRYPDMIYVIHEPLPHIIDIAIESYPHAVSQVNNVSNEQLIRAISIDPNVLNSIPRNRLADIDDYVKNYATLMK